LFDGETSKMEKKAKDVDERMDEEGRP